MKRLIVFLSIVVFVGCANDQNIQQDIKDRIDNRPNVCATLDAEESALCAAATRMNINLSDIAVVARNAVPIAIMAKYKAGPERDRAIEKAVGIAEDIDSYLDGTVTGSNLFQFIKLKSDDDKMYALFAYEVVNQLLNAPEVYSVPLTEWDKNAIKGVLQEIIMRLEIIRGGE